MANDEIYLPSQHIWTPDQQKERDTRSFLTRIEGFEHLVNMHEMPDEIIFTGGGMHGSFQTGVLEALINTGVLQQNENAPRIHGTSVGACIAFLYASAEHRPGTFEDERNLKFFTDAMLKTGVIHKGWPPLNAGKLYYMLATHPKMNPDLLKQSPQPVLATVVAMDRSSAQERFTANIDLRTANDPVQVVLASCLMPRIFDDTDAIILKNEIDYFTGEIINGPCVDGGYGDYPIGIVPLLERTNGLDHPDKIKHILVVTGNPQDNKLAVDIGIAELNAITVGLKNRDILLGQHGRYAYEWSLLTGGRRKALENTYFCKITIIYLTHIHSFITQNTKKLTESYRRGKSEVEEILQNIL